MITLRQRNNISWANKESHDGRSFFTHLPRPDATDGRTHERTPRLTRPRSLAPSLSLLFPRIKSAHMAGISIVIIRCHREPRATLTDDEKSGLICVPSFFNSFQSPRNGEDLSDGEPGSPDGRSSAGDRGGTGGGGVGGGGGGGLARETTPEAGERDGSSALQGGIGGVRLKVRGEGGKGNAIYASR